jgi:hypothetical protein
VVHSHEYGKFLTGPNHTPVFYTLNTGVWFVPLRKFAVFMRENFKKTKKNTEGDDTQRYKKKRERDGKRER